MGLDSSAETKSKIKKKYDNSENSPESGGERETVAQNLLKQHLWNVETAVNAYFQSCSVRTTTSTGTTSRKDDFSLKKLQAVFDSFKDEPDAILIEGTEKYCQALEVDPTDVVVLVLAKHLYAKQMCEFRKEDFVKGWTNLQCDSLEKQRKKLSDFRAELNDPAAFKEIYFFAFQFGLGQGQKSLPLDLAVGFWQLLLPPTPLLNSWLEFLQGSSIKGISKDTWNLWLEFMRSVKPDFSNYEEDGAWPVLIDDFVQYMKLRSSSS